jgi:hypothetical protein
MTNFKITTSNPLTAVNVASNPIGAAIIQNLMEYNSATSTALVLMAADGDTNTPISNILLWHNTLTGQRINRCYNDSGSTPYFRYGWSEIGQLYDSTAVKSDTFSPGNAARVGNWGCEYGVGYYGDIDAETGTSSNPVGVGGGFQTEFPGLYSNFIVKNSNTNPGTEPPSNAAGMNALSWLGFVNRAGWTGVSVGAGNGNYHISPTSPAVGLMPTGTAVLPFDLDGNPRLNNGNGSAGAYEEGASSSTPRSALFPGLP